MANNKVTIYIHNQRYRFLAEENEDYLQQCADIVNKEMDNAMDGNTLSITDGAVLAAMNVADKYCKERLVSDNLRAEQIYIHNPKSVAKEMSEMKREARKATKEKAKAKREAKVEAKAEAEGKAEEAQPSPAETQEAQTEEST